MEDLLQKCDASMAAVAEATTEATRKNMTVNELADDYSKSKTSVVFESSASVMLNKVRTRSMGHVIGKVRRLSAYDNGDQ